LRAKNEFRKIANDRRNVERYYRRPGRFFDKNERSTIRRRRYRMTEILSIEDTAASELSSFEKNKQFFRK